MKAITSQNISAPLGSDITVMYMAARDSTGNDNSVSQLTVLFEDSSGSVSELTAPQDCNMNPYTLPCYQYPLIIRNILPKDTGVYTARLRGMCLVCIIICTCTCSGLE